MHYDAYIPFTGYYALCSDMDDLFPKSRNWKEVSCRKCLKLRKKVRWA
jgi:hypothetical protein